MSAFATWQRQSIEQAWRDGQIASLTHLLARGLRELADPRTLRVAEALESNVLQEPELQTAAADRPKAFFQPKAAESSFEQFSRTAWSQDPHARLPEQVVRWLLGETFTDVTSKRARSVWEPLELPRLLDDIARERTQQSGEFVDDDWCDRNTVEKLEGRGTELDDHLSLLTLAIRGKSHYVLTGPAYVGKSLFLRHLVARLRERLAQAADPTLHELRLLYVGEHEWYASEDELEARLRSIYNRVRADRGLVPVLDGVDRLLEDPEGRGAMFAAFFGGLLAGRGRTVVLAARTGSLERSPLFRSLPTWPLAPVPADRCPPIVRERLKGELALARAETEGDLDALVREMVYRASAFYPGGVVLDVALRLAAAVVQRALARALDTGTTPRVRIQDLRRHVASEQFLSIEVLDKEPRKFYADAAAAIKKALIGQDHAVDTVCRVLARKAMGEPTPLPRGRFLLAGPPGVGKTLLARRLAEELGYGRAGLFRYNMSDFANDGDRWRFIGAPVGYEGFGSVRTVFDEVRARPSCIILLDEIDRAHQAIQDILLSMLEGEGKDGQNQTVYFSQAIFILTTNLGQDQINAGYGRVRGRLPRDQIARHFNRVLAGEDPVGTPDAADQRDLLRELILAGAVDETERRMQLQLDANVGAAKQGFDSLDPEQRLQAIQSFIDLRDLRRSLERTARRSAFDAAFLDRVDFVVPMLPIAEPDLIEQIVDLNLRQAGWPDCPYRTGIIRRTIAHAQGVRIIGRIIESLRDADFAAAFQSEHANAH